MRYQPPQEEFKLYETGFEGDASGRYATAKRLSEIVDRIEDPLVIALNGKWGTGKTYFLKRWVGAHALNGGKAITVYFDSFTNDYSSEPLIGLLSAIRLRVPPEKKSAFDIVRNLAVQIVKPATRVGLAVITSGTSELTGNVGDSFIASLSGETKEALDRFWKQEDLRHQAFNSFRQTLEKITDNESGEKTPIVIVIDELDRCRPDYAIQMIEIIKHFFSVPYVHFVLGINSDAIESIVKVRYGPEIDAHLYVQKFISIWMKLPNDVGDGNRTELSIAHIEKSGKLRGIDEIIIEKIKQNVICLRHKYNFTIRDIQHILSNVALLPDEVLFCRVSKAWMDATVLMLVIKNVDRRFYEQFLDGAVSMNDLDNFFGYKYHEVMNKNIQITSDEAMSAHIKNVFPLFVYLSGLGDHIERSFFAKIIESFTETRYFYRLHPKLIVEKIDREWI